MEIPRVSAVLGSNHNVVRLNYALGKSISHDAKDQEQATISQLSYRRIPVPAPGLADDHRSANGDLKLLA